MDLNPSSLQPLAAVAGGAFLLAFTLIILREDLRDRRRAEAGELPEGHRFHHYAVTIRRLWIMASVSLLAWAATGQPLADIGLTAGNGWRPLASWAIVGAIGGWLLFDFFKLVFSPASRREAARQLDRDKSVSLIRPTTNREHKRFQWLAITAGITEEIVFRGFAIAALGLFLPVWGAVLAASCAFILLHSYQGWAGMLKVTAMTVVLTGLYLLGGSLYPVIVLHILVDAMAGGMFALLQSGQSADQKSVAGAT